MITNKWLRLFYFHLKIIFFQVVFCLQFLQNTYAYNTPHVKWATRNPFNENTFIENNGQFNFLNDLHGYKIYYATHTQNLYYFFTDKGFIAMRYSCTRNSRINRAQNDGEEGDELDFKMDRLYQVIEWDGINPNAQIDAQEKISGYYTYMDPLDSSGRTAVKAEAFKDIIYRNIYPGIDLKYEMDQDTFGLKYSFIIHPGGNPAEIRMKPGSGSDISFDKNGNMVIRSSLNVLFDHKPSAFNEANNTKVNCNFQIENGAVSFAIGEYDKNQVLIIDPWIIDPNFPVSDKAFDVDYDNQGNIYVAGGGGGPFYLNKYDSNGNLLWTYVAFPTVFGGMYGDFAIDKRTGSVYIIEGIYDASVSPGARVVKLNSAGIQVALFSGNANMREMWRIAFSACTNQAVIAGGGTTSPTFQTCYLDTSLNNINPVQYIVSNTECCHDVNCIALDNFGYCYQVTNKSSGGPLFNNQLVKLPVTNLSAIVYNVSTGYNFFEFSSNAFYTPPQVFYSNGLNGIATHNTSVYMSDGYVLKKWDGNSGNLLQYKRIQAPPLNDSSKIWWSGIAVNDCDSNVFVGDLNAVKQYDGNLNPVNTYPLPDTVFDVRLMNDGTLLACGCQFLEVLTISSPCPDIIATVTPASCDSLGSASVTINGGNPPYTVTWSTLPPITGTTVSNLSPGNYFVTIQDNSCDPYTRTETISITDPSVYLLGAIESSRVNVFTPNSDGENDFFLPFTDSTLAMINNQQTDIRVFDLKIYDRWGVLIYETNSVEKGWNGKDKNGMPVSQGVYYWIADIQSDCFKSNPQHLEGFVELFR